MAYESYYWRKIVAREVKYVEKRMKLERKQFEKNIDEYFSEVEIRIMTLAYIVRKLADTDKLPDEALQRRVKLFVYPRNKFFSRRGYVDIEREYDLKTKQEESLNLREIANQIIHSYVLQMICTRRSIFKYVWFVSDHNKDNGLFEIKTKHLLAELLRVSDKRVNKLIVSYDKDRERWIKIKS